MKGWVGQRNHILGGGPDPLSGNFGGISWPINWKELLLPLHNDIDTMWLTFKQELQLGPSNLYRRYVILGKRKDGRAHWIESYENCEYPTCPWYSQSYSVDGGSDAAFYCQYCVNLLLWLLWPAELSWCYTFVWDWVLSAGERLNVCSGRMTCCTPDMETYLVNKTRWQFQGRVLTKMRKLHLLFANVTSVFDGMILNYSSEYMQLW